MQLGEKKTQATMPPASDSCHVQSTKTIDMTVRRELHNRASGQCEHVDKKTGMRCQARTHLQVEHCYPRAWGGDHKLSNLMILCRSHNLARASQSFGVSKIARSRGLQPPRPKS